jgi:DNA segregation ATPase FtsK/SpoIIIE, S-DNA-T family
MASARSLFGRAVAAHRQARGLQQAARAALWQAERSGADPIDADRLGTAGPASPGLDDLVLRLQQAGAALTPGWWTASWDAPPSDRGFGLDGAPGRWSLVRIGSSPVRDGFPVVVPFVGAGHLVLDEDAGDLRVAGFVRSVLLRTLAAMPAGSVRVLAVDGGGLGTTFAPLRPLIGAGLMTEPATDLDGLGQVLAEAEQRVRHVQVDAEPGPLLLVTVAALPPDVGPELARLAVLARAGVEGGVHLLVAGHPDPASLPGSTAITRSGDAFAVGEPPGSQRFGVAGEGLAVPVLLDTGPPGRLLAAVCGRIAERAVAQAAVGLDELIGPRVWTGSAAEALTAPIGRGLHGAAEVELSASRPHWLIAGRTGSGTTPALLDLLLGLASRYSPDELGLYLLDYADGVCFAELAPTELDPTWVPQVRAIGIECDREYGVSVLTAVAAEAGRRVAAMKQAGVADFARLRAARPMAVLPRLVVAIEEAGRLFGVEPGPRPEQARPDRAAVGQPAEQVRAEQAAGLLSEVLRRGGDCGIHLVLTSSSASGPAGLRPADLAGFGRIQVTGPDLVQLDQRRVNVPVPAAEQVEQLRGRLWRARPPGHPPPARYDGSAELHVADDPQAQALDRTGRRRMVVLGRAVELATPPVSFTLDASPGRHLVVLGSSEIGSDLLHAAVWQLCRQHPPGAATLLLAGLVAAADDAVEDAAAVAQVSGHECRLLDAGQLRRTVLELAGRSPAGNPADDPTPTYLVVFGGDEALAAPELAAPTATLLRDGPAAGVHLLGWWRDPARFAAELGAGQVAGLVVLNVPAVELEQLGRAWSAVDPGWQPRPDRALFLDRQEGRRQLLIPFVRPGRAGEAL